MYSSSSTAAADAIDDAGQYSRVGGQSDDPSSINRALPPPTVPLDSEAPLQYQTNTILPSPAGTNSPSTTSLTAGATPDYGQLNASFPAMSAPPHTSSNMTIGGAGSPIMAATANMVDAAPFASATALPRMAVPSPTGTPAPNTHGHYSYPSAQVQSEVACLGGSIHSSSSSWGLAQQQQRSASSSGLANDSNQVPVGESMTVSQQAPSTHQHVVYYQPQTGVLYQQPCQQYQQYPSCQPQQRQSAQVTHGAQWTQHSQNSHYAVQQGSQQQHQNAFNAVTGSTLPTSPQSVASDPLSLASTNTPMSPPNPPHAPASNTFGTQPQMSIGSDGTASATPSPWPRPQHQPELPPSIAPTDAATQAQPSTATLVSGMDQATAVAAAAMASMIGSASSQHSMDPHASLPSMLFPANPPTPPSPMDSLAIAAAAASSNGDSPPSFSSSGYTPRPRATRLRPPKPYPYMITMAILDSPRRKLTLRELYSAIQAQYPQLYGPQGPAGHVQKSSQSWKNTVRFNLSRSGLFVRLDEFDRVDIGRAGTGPGRRSAYWTIAPHWMERIQREGPGCVLKLGDARKSRSATASLMSGQDQGAAAGAATAAEAGEDEEDEVGLDQEGLGEESRRSSLDQQHHHQYPHNQVAVPQAQPPSSMSAVQTSSYPVSSPSFAQPPTAYPSTIAYQQQQQGIDLNPANIQSQNTWTSSVMQLPPAQAHQQHPSQLMASPTSPAFAGNTAATMPWPPAAAPAASGDWYRLQHQQPPHVQPNNPSPVLQTATLVAVKHEPGSPYAYALYQPQPPGQKHHQMHLNQQPPPPPQQQQQQPSMGTEGFVSQQPQQQQPNGGQDQPRPGAVRWLLN